MGDRSPAVLPPADLRGDGAARGGQPRGVHGGQACRRGPHPQFGGAGGGDVGGKLRREERPRHALRDGPAEEPGCLRQGQQRGDRSATRRLAEDRHPVRVAAEGPDVVAHPLQRGDLVEQAPVGRGAVDLRETLHAQPVVERHHDGAAGGQPAAVELRKAGRADHVAAAGDPHQHRQAGPRGRIGRPDVDRKPVAARRLLCGPVHPEQAGLRRRRAERECRPHPRPAAHRPRCGEPERADRRLGVPDAAEDRQPRLPAAAQHPGRRPDLRPGRGLRRPG